MTAASATTSAVRAITSRRAGACGSPGCETGAGVPGALASAVGDEGDTRVGIGTAADGASARPAGASDDSPGVPQ